MLYFEFQTFNMAYDEYLAERVRRFWQAQKVDFYEMKMMGG
jgi:hypothetical protein